jgi:hypothetical protein
VSEYRSLRELGFRSESASRDPARSVAPNLLQQPQIAIRVAELSKRHVAAVPRIRARSPSPVIDVANLANTDATCDQLVTRSGNIFDDQVQARAVSPATR